MIALRWAYILCIGIGAWIVATQSVLAEPTENRVALVIGNANYQAAPLALPANDAGLIAQTLQAAGFDVVGARDLDADSLRHTFRDFLDKVAASGPNTVAFVYVAGYGVQYEGENYLVPVDATLARDVDVPVQAVRLSDYTRPLSTMPLKARFIVVDGARDNPFARTGNPLASGLALVNAEPGVVYAFNAAPGTVAPESPGPYGPYAQAVAEMIREGGLGPAELFDQIRQRVNSVTSGAFVPWSVARIEAPFVFFERAADAPPPLVSRADRERRRSRALRELEVEDAYHEALDRDTLDAYQDFLDAYPNHKLAKRVRVIVAARREAIIWHRSYERDTPEAYWTYLDRYPDGPHAWDARRRLRRLAAEFDAPPAFAHLEYDIPPPPPEEIVFVRRRVVFFSDPYYGFAPPPPPPIYYISPPPPDFAILVAPAVVVEAYVLPVPVFVPVARWCDPPRYVAPPPNNIIFNNIHTTVVVNNVTNTTVNSTTSVTTPATVSGTTPGVLAKPQVGAVAAGAVVAGAAVAGAALRVALPPAIARRQAATQTQSPAGSQPAGNTPAPLVSPNGQPIPQVIPKQNPQLSAPSSAANGNQNGVNPKAPLAPASAIQGATAPPAAKSLTTNAPAQALPQGVSAPSQPQASPLMTSPTPPTLPAPRATTQSTQIVPPASDPKNRSPSGVAPSPPKPRAATASDKVQPDLAAERQRQRDLQAAQEARQQKAEQRRAQQAQQERQRQQEAARDSERRAQQQRTQQAQQDRQRQQQAAQEAQRRAQQQSAQEAQRRAQQQAAQEAQRRAQSAQLAQQRAAQEASRQRAQQAAKKPCGQPGLPACQ